MTRTYIKKPVSLKCLFKESKNDRKNLKNTKKEVSRD